MYLNVICLKCGKTLQFQTKIPFSADKVVEGWNIISDDVNHQIFSIVGTEIASICSVALESENKATKRKRSSKIKIEE